MTALFHGPPTRGPVMNFCESETPRRQEKKKSRSARCCFSPAHVYPAREPRARRAAFGVDCATPYVTGFVPTNRSRAPPKRAPKMGTPLDQSEQCSLGACTQRHMARIRCPCERARGSGTLLLCQMLTTQRLSGTPNLVLKHGNIAKIRLLAHFKTCDNLT